jgi:hypothetical protein
MKKEEEKEPLRLYFIYDEHRSGGESLEPDNRWSSHADINIEVKFHEFYRNPPTHRFFYDSKEVSEEIYNASRAYLAVVRYSTGSTFGNTYGAWHIVGIALTREDAEKMLKEAVEDEGGYKPWVGYFESLTDTEVYGLVIE